MLVTKKWIVSNKTRQGGWSRKQMSILGVDWQPKKGWIKGVVGMIVSEDDRLLFESFSKNRQYDNRKS